MEQLCERDKYGDGGNATLACAEAGDKSCVPIIQGSLSYMKTFNIFFNLISNWNSSTGLKQNGNMWSAVWNITLLEESSNFSVHQIHLERSSKHVAGPLSKVSDFICLGSGRRICLSNRIPDLADAAGLESSFEDYKSTVRWTNWKDQKGAPGGPLTKKYQSSTQEFMDIWPREIERSLLM